jgi:opacity protein-like surface antigen
MKKILCAAVAAAALLSTPASAAITWTPAGGGQVGKGDVQVPLGLNNAQMQDMAKFMSFSYHVKRSYNVACFNMQPDFVLEPDGVTRTGEIKYKKVKTMVRVENDFHRVSNISASVEYDTRNKKQVVGFILAPVGPATGPAIVPVCPGGWDLDLTDDLGNAQDPVSGLVISDQTLSANGTALPTYFPAP